MLRTRTQPTQPEPMHRWRLPVAATLRSVGEASGVGDRAVAVATAARDFAKVQVVAVVRGVAVAVVVAVIKAAGQVQGRRGLVLSELAHAMSISWRRRTASQS